MITFQEIDHTTGHYELEVAEDQKDFVATIPVLLARAFIYRKCRSRAYIIFADETPVGMDLYYDREEDNDFRVYNFAELFIDRRYQGRGYATEAVRLLLDEMRADGKYDRVYLFVVRGNDAARHLYEKFGFKETCSSDAAIGMELVL